MAILCLTEVSAPPPQPGTSPKQENCVTSSMVNSCGDLADSVTYEADIVSHAGEGVKAGTPVVAPLVACCAQDRIGAHALTIDATGLLTC